MIASKVAFVGRENQKISAAPGMFWWNFSRCKKSGCAGWPVKPPTLPTHPTLPKLVRERAKANPVFAPHDCVFAKEDTAGTRRDSVSAKTPFVRAQAEGISAKTDGSFAKTGSVSAHTEPIFAKVSCVCARTEPIFVKVGSSFGHRCSCSGQMPRKLTKFRLERHFFRCTAHQHLFMLTEWAWGCLIMSGSAE